MSKPPQTAGIEPEPAGVSVRILHEPPGRTAVPGLRRPRVAIHLGNSVYMSCQRAGRRHTGMVVHGDVEIIPAQTPSIWEHKETDTALILALEPALIVRVVEESGAEARCVEVLNRFQVRDPQIEHIGWALKAEMEAGFPSGRIFADSLATALAACVARRHSSAAPIASHHRGGLPGSKFKLAISFIEDNLGQDISLSDIAGASGVSVTHFKTAFRQTMGVPVHQYVIQRRVERARVLLCESRLSVTEIASQTGFAHQSHLAFHMRRALGYSPRAIRNRVQ